MTEHQNWQDRWRNGADLCMDGLTDSGLGSLADLTRDLFGAVRPLLLQMAWLVQPGASMLGDREAIPALIALLDDPSPDPDAEAHPL